MESAATVIVSSLMLLVAVFQNPSTQGKVLYFNYKVLDRTGTPVPNARFTLVAVDDQGRSYGPDAEWSTGGGTNLSGLGAMGFGTPVKQRPGKLRLVSRHPSIGEVRKTLPWSAVLHDVRPLQPFSEPVFVLRADGGPGLEAWRVVAAKKAPALVQSLMKAKDEKEVDSLTAQLVVGEMMSIPPLVAALQDYENPLRRRLLRALMRTWNGCGGQGQLDVAIRRKALAIHTVNTHVVVLAVKPQAGPTLLGGEREIVREIAWAIEDLQERIAAAREKGDTYQASADELVLTKMKEVQRQMAKDLDPEF